jgi:hypothetical protein
MGNAPDTYPLYHLIADNVYARRNNDGKKYSDYFCLGASGSQRTEIALKKFTASIEQKWYLIDRGGGYYNICQFGDPVKFLTKGTGNTVTLEAYTYNDNQLWHINEEVPGNALSRNYTDISIPETIQHTELVRRYDPTISQANMGNGWIFGFQGRLKEYCASEKGSGDATIQKYKVSGVT